MAGATLPLAEAVTNVKVDLRAAITRTADPAAVIREVSAGTGESREFVSACLWEMIRDGVIRRTEDWKVKAWPLQL